MARRKTSVIQVMITGDSRDLQSATRKGASAFDMLGVAAIAATKIIASTASAIAGFSLREFAKFDDAMTKSTAIMGDLSETMRKDLSNAAREVATTTSFSASEAAEALQFLALAGLDAEQSMAALPRVAAFAQAGNFDMARATDLLTDAQSALGLTVSDTAENMQNMARVSDVLVKASTIANASTEQFSESLTNKAGAALRVMNKDLEEGAAVLAFFADQGVKGSAAGESLAIVLRDVTRAAARNEDKFKELGLSVLDSEGNLKNLADVVESFTDVLGPMSDAQAASTLENLGLTRAVGNNIRQLLGGADAIRDYERQLREAGGTTQDVADKQLQSFSAQLGLLRSGLADVGITIGEALAGPLGQFVAWFRDRVPDIKAFVEEAIPQVEAFVGRAIVKFKEFKEFYEDNLAEPLGNLMGRLRELGGEGLSRLMEFKDRAVAVLGDFAQAVADADSEEAGKVIGEAIGDLLEIAFDTGIDMVKVASDWAKAQDWTAIGMAVGKEATLFTKGLFQGLFNRIDDETGEQQFDWSRFMRLLAAGLALRIPVFRNALAQRTGLFALPIVGTIATALSYAVLLLTPGFGKFAASIGRLISGALGSMVAGTRFAGIFSNIGLTIQRLFAGQFASLPARLLAAITGMFSGIGAMLLRHARLLPTHILQGIRVGLPTLVVWFKTGGLLTLLKGFGVWIAGLVAAVGGWPIVLTAAAVLAFMEFLRRFIRWNNSQEGEYSSIGEKIVAFISNGVDKMKDWFDRTIRQWFRDRINSIKQGLQDARAEFTGMGEGMISNIVAGIRGKASELRDTLVGAAERAWSATKRFLGINSPSRLFEDIGEGMMEGLSKGVSESAGVVQAAVGVNSAMAANEARRFAEMAAAQRAARGPAAAQNIEINVQGGISSAEEIAREIEKALGDSERRTGSSFIEYAPGLFAAV